MTEHKSSRMFIVNLAQLATLLLNFAAVIWFAASLSAATSQNSTDISKLQSQDSVFSTAQTSMISDISAMKATLVYQTEILNDIKDTVNSQTRKR